MSRQEHKICDLKSTVTGTLSAVTLRPGYGVVIPDLWTTNGSVAYAARLIHSHVQAGAYTVENAVCSLPTEDEGALKTALLELYGKAAGVA